MSDFSKISQLKKNKFAEFLLYPLDIINGLSPFLRTNFVRYKTKGVLPVPPAVIFPIDITGNWDLYMLIKPESYSQFLTLTKIKNNIL